MINNYNVLIIGTGNIAKKHSNILKRKNVKKIINISSRNFNLNFLKKKIILILHLYVTCKYASKSY